MFVFERNSAINNAAVYCVHVLDKLHVKLLVLLDLHLNENTG